MKNKLTLIYTILILSFFGCKVRDVEPQFQVAEDEAITDEVSAEAALTGDYNAVSKNEYYGVNYRIISILSASNIVKWVGNSNNNRQFNSHNLFADNTTINDTWAAIYRSVNISNNIIDKVPSLTDAGLTDADKNRLTGEALFLRALAYFDLGRAFGAVPILTKPTRTVNDGIGIGRSPISVVYDQVLNDLNEAENLLPDVLNRNRATKNTARALRARLHLYRGEWQAAADDATKLIGNPDYTLVSPYASFYLTKNTKESIFEIDYTINNKNSYATNWLPGSLGGRRELVPTAEFVTQVKDSTIGGNRKAYILEKLPAESGQTLYGNMNFKISTGDDQTYVLRIAEMYLIRAEANARLGAPDSPADISALLDLNAVEKRATVPDVSALTNQQLIDAVINERKYEFAFEGQYWFDLVRTDKAAATLGFTNKDKYLFPIPQNQLLFDKDLTQNPSY